jgi:hypothetical protein
MISIAGFALAESPAAVCRLLAAWAVVLMVVGAIVFGHDRRPELACAG